MVAQLHYELVQTRNLKFEVAMHGQGDRLALLLHGFPECAHSYRHQIPVLERLGYRVWAPNLRGYGNSDKPLGRRAYTIDRLEQDVTDLIDASGARSVLLVGHDWGGAIAWSYAMHGPRPLEKLVVMNCPHPVVFQRGLLRPSQLSRSSYMFFFQLPWLPEHALRRDDYRAIEQALRGMAVHPEQFSDADMALYRANAAQPGALTAMLNYYRAMPLSIVGLRKRGLKKIAVPTLLIWGEQDHALGKELTLGTERYVDELTTRFVPDASHWVQQDTPETVNALLEQWLATPPQVTAA
jgi:pimeloyl-ACP methyl ester carboxylesterase